MRRSTVFQGVEQEAEAPAKEAVPEEKPEALIYRETANYAYEAGELESYRASLAANVECRRAIEAAISSNYGDNRLDADAAVKSVLEQFSPERVRYVLANTIQQKDFDGRIPQPLKEWAKSIAEEIIKKKLAACADLFSIESIYRWKGNINNENEVGAVFKIRSEDFEEFSECVRSLHPYEVPCIVSYEISNGTDDYLDWIRESTIRD